LYYIEVFIAVILRQHLQLLMYITLEIES